MASSSSIQCQDDDDASLSDSDIDPRTKELEKKLKNYLEVKTMVGKATDSNKNAWRFLRNDRITRLLKSICVPWFLSENHPESVFDRIQVDGTILYPSNPADRETLINLSKPAPFGRGTETVFDETVRKALEITADRLVVDKKPITTILSTIEETWYNYTFDAKLYKMHIYQETGQFLVHRDTVHDPSHIATLVVSLNDAEEGGELVVRHNAASHTWNPPGWCAFFTDCKHEVKEVKKGCRIVLQYDLYAKVKRSDTFSKKKKHRSKKGLDYSNSKEFSKSMPSIEKERSDNTVFPEVVKNQIKQELRTILKFNQKEQFGVLLGHSYVEISGDNLKGADLVLYQIIQEMDEIEPELIHVTVFSEDFEPGDNEEYGRVRIIPILPRKDRTPIKILASLLFEKYPLFEFQPGADHVGNDAAPTSFAYHAAVLAMKMKPTP